ncbi:MAG: rod shape-determining protein MreC [Desulfobacteraceae bacterium]|nr:rod shape-determining protein MreC [Desulfobacteraceae bacterium]
MFSKKMVIFVGVIFLFAACILLITLTSRQPQVAQGPGRFAISLVAPFQQMIVSSSRFCRDVWKNYFALVSVAEENQRLQKELRKAQSLNHRCSETLLANVRFHALLDLKHEIKHQSIAAQVISKDPSPWFQTLLIGKGSDDGIIQGAPVINTQGVVGLVVQVTDHYAKVRIVTDPNSSVDSVIQKSRARGILKGGTSGYCVLDYVLHKHLLNLGDTVVTSGMDGVFPKGLPIGRVTDILKHDAGIFQEVTVIPYVDFERLEEVLVITPSAQAGLQ